VKLPALLLASGLLIAAVFLLEPIAQDPGYHEFADSRRLLGIANFLNVSSNFLFLPAGIAGLALLGRGSRDGILTELRPAYAGFFIGIFLIGIGSSWYHLAPDNATLLWDRAPMTIAFMSLFTIIVGEQVSIRIAQRLFIPLIAAGTLSVLYWYLTETTNVLCIEPGPATCGDLRLYVLVQFLPMVLIPVLLVAWRSPFDRTGFLWGMLLLYVASKLLELFDAPVFRMTGAISGHSIKHLLAATSALLFLYGLRTRRPSEKSGNP